MEESKRAKRQTARRRSGEAAPNSDAATASPESSQILHNLELHQTELEAQNVELREAMGALEASQQKYRDFFDSAPLGYFDLDTQSRIREVNRRGIEQLRTGRSDLIGKPFKEFVAPPDQERYSVFLLELPDSSAPRSLELRLMREDQESFLARIEASAIAGSADSPLSIRLAVTDITQRRAVEERMSLVFELSQDGIVITRKGGQLVQVNPAACRILGRPATELLTMSAYEMETPPGAPPIGEQLAAFRREEPIYGELQLLRPDGKPRTLEFNTRVLSDDLFLTFLRDVTERRAAEKQLRLYSEHLEELVDQRADRIRELERHRSESDKLAATGRMAARIAHEINNPLAGIKNSFLLIKDAISPDYPYFRYVASIEKEINRIARIVSQMFDLYQPDQEQPQRFNLGEIIEDVLLMLEPLCRQHGVTISTRLPEFPVIVFQPEGLVRQVLYNIIANAIEASPRDEAVKIHAALASDTVSISVSDKGPGISEEVAVRLFEPFFTTKLGRYDEGIGLGLSVSRTLVELMHGALTYQSKVGEGTVFRVVLPQDAAIHRREDP